MKKQNNQETIPPVFPNDYEIVKEVQPDGSIVFRHPVGSEVDVWTEDLDTLFSLMTEHFMSLTDLLSDEDRVQFGFILSLMVGHYQNQFYEIFHFLDKSVGTISISLIMKDQTCYRTGRVVDVTLAPPKNCKGDC